MRPFAAPWPSRSKKGVLILECDVLWPYVGKKRRQKWVWLALNRDTREIVGMAVGARGGEHHGC